MFHRTVSTQIERQLAINGSNHALVIGGSMAGLLAARVLTDYFDSVTIVERDRFPKTPGPRRGVPQSCHVHVLLVQGQRILEQLFPGLEAELTAAGASTVDWTADCSMLGFSGWEPRFSSGLITRTCSRNLLEWTVRHRLAAYSNIRFLDDRQVLGLLSNASKTSVTGVRVRHYNYPQQNPSATEEALQANLVVDASGRNSQAPQWLEALGYAPPQETVINSFLGYASRWYRRPAGLRSEWQTLVVWPKPPDSPRAGMLYPIKGDRWILTVAGVGRDYPPTDEAGFLEFTRSLRSSILYEAIKDAQPLSSIYGYRRTENHRRHYERLSRWPEGFVAVGDAVCAFNPIYAQGMTVAAMGALTLAQCLSEQHQRQPNGDLTGLAQRFQRKLVKVNATPWMMATGEDLRWATTQGGQPAGSYRLMHWYLDRVRLLTTENPNALKAFMEVLHLLKPPTTLFRPDILVQVLKRVVTVPMPGGVLKLRICFYKD
jgi:2-polyprenyl-6-methoxyphenol hydroxylase-like FAD-dependent oxidoreductase